jgi:TonB family protein
MASRTRTLTLPVAMALICACAGNHNVAKNEASERERTAQSPEAIAQVGPENQNYYETIFTSYDQRKDYKGMVTFFRNVVQHYPDSVPVHNYLLYGQLKLGDNKAALKELEDLIRLQPKEKKHLRQAANLYESSGECGEALKKLDQILKLDPKDKEAKDDYLRVKMCLSLGKDAQVGQARKSYYTEIWNAIHKQWAVPEYLKSQRLETVLVIVVRRDGKVLDLRVKKSSGNEIFDESARQAVRKAEPLPAFPAIYNPDQEEIALRFRPQE